MASKAKGGQRSKGGSMTMREAGHLGGKAVQQERDLRDSKQVRHQAYDKPGPPKGEAFGIAAITQALDGLEFPATKEALLKRAGRQSIEYRKGQPVNLRKIVEDLEDEEFPSMAQVVHSVSQALKEEGLSHGEEQPSA